MLGQFYQRRMRVSPARCTAAMDTIFISDLKVDTRIGVYEWEKHVRQPVMLNIEIAMRDAKAGVSDDFADALDYAAVVGRVKALLADHPHHLLERLAEAVAQLVLEEFRAPWVRVQLAKLAPLPGVRQLGVAIERGKRPG
jgi:dihydroneopterin aldolase